MNSTHEPGWRPCLNRELVRRQLGRGVRLGTYEVRALRRSVRRLTDGLTITIGFRTGCCLLEPHLQAELAALAGRLRGFPSIGVRLDGYADVRGSRRFNRVLSRRRVSAVTQILIAAGLPARRIRGHAHGDDRSRYRRGDREGYAFDRRVVVRLEIDSP